jgi:hypothetical protein
LCVETKKSEKKYPVFRKECGRQKSSGRWVDHYCPVNDIARKKYRSAMIIQFSPKHMLSRSISNCPQKNVLPKKGVIRKFIFRSCISAIIPGVSNSPVGVTKKKYVGHEKKIFWRR